jgi:hypothetical protein
MLTIIGLLTAPEDMLQRVVAAIQPPVVSVLELKKTTRSASSTPVLRESGVVKPQRELAVDLIAEVEGYLIERAASR